MFDVLKHRAAPTADHVIALIIDADQIEFSAIVIERDVFLTQQFHAMALEQRLGCAFRASVDFVITVAPPGAERARNLLNSKMQSSSGSFSPLMKSPVTIAMSGLSSLAIATARRTSSRGIKSPICMSLSWAIFMPSSSLGSPPICT